MGPEPQHQIWPLRHCDGESHMRGGLPDRLSQLGGIDADLFGSEETEAALRISLAHRSSVTSRLSRSSRCAPRCSPRPAGRHPPQPGAPSCATSAVGYSTWRLRPRSRPTPSHSSLAYLGDHPHRTLLHSGGYFDLPMFKTPIAFSTDGAYGHAGVTEPTGSTEEQRTQPLAVLLRHNKRCETMWCWCVWPVVLMWVRPLGG